jgi:hypothetical protein
LTSPYSVRPLKISLKLELNRVNITYLTVTSSIADNGKLQTLKKKKNLGGSGDQCIGSLLDECYCALPYTATQWFCKSELGVMDKHKVSFCVLLFMLWRPALLLGSVAPVILFKMPVIISKEGYGHHSTNTPRTQN